MLEPLILLITLKEESGKKYCFLAVLKHKPSKKKAKPFFEKKTFKTSPTTGNTKKGNPLIKSASAFFDSSTTLGKK